MLKRTLRKYPAFYQAARSARNWVRRWIATEVILPLNRRRELSLWLRSGRPVPPPDAFKHAIVRTYGRTFRLTTLVETGTYLGDMVEAQRTRFRQVWSIELSPELHRAALARFAHARNVILLEGDSADLIETVVARLGGPALFWLDGHYSAGNTARASLDTPIRRELEEILGSHYAHVILVDDARHFGTGDYPTLDAVRALVAERRPGWTCVVKNDVIRIAAP